MISIELVLVGAGVVLGFLLLVKLLALMVWAEAKAVNLPLSLLDVVGMRIRGTDPASVVRPAVIAKAAGHPVDVRFLESQVEFVERRARGWS